MDSWVFVVVGIGAFLVLFFGGFIALMRKAAQQEQARIASLVALCGEYGWRISEQDPYDLVHRWPGTPFDDGSMRRVRNVVTGEYAGRPMLAFDYSYETEGMRDSNGRRSTWTHHHGVVALALPGALPELALMPENVFARIARKLGYQDVKLGREDFDRMFVVGCHDTRVVPYVLTPRAADALVHHGPVSLRVAGSDLLAWGDALTPDRLLRLAQLLAEIVHGIPDAAWEQAPGPLR
ncbi:MAG TPA: hypothetical protein VNA20_16665 [Frankiaceae bacterium]|nr:hypothetical protein [Frankiaceae bacterium]